MADQIHEAPNQLLPVDDTASIADNLDAPDVSLEAKAAPWQKVATEFGVILPKLNTKSQSAIELSENIAGRMKS